MHLKCVLRLGAGGGIKGVEESGVRRGREGVERENEWEWNNERNRKGKRSKNEGKRRTIGRGAGQLSPLLGNSVRNLRHQSNLAAG